MIERLENRTNHIGRLKITSTSIFLIMLLPLLSLIAFPYISSIPSSLERLSVLAQNDQAVETNDVIASNQTITLSEEQKPVIQHYSRIPFTIDSNATTQQPSVTVKLQEVKFRDENSTLMSDDEPARLWLVFSVNEKFLLVPQGNESLELPNPDQQYIFSDDLSLTVTPKTAEYDLEDFLPAPLQVTVVVLDETLLPSDCVNLFRDNFENALNELSLRCYEDDPFSTEFIPAVSRGYVPDNNFSQGIHIANTTTYSGRSFDITYEIIVNGEIGTSESNEDNFLANIDPGRENPLHIDSKNGYLDGCDPDPLGRLEPEWIPVRHFYNGTEATPGEPMEAEGIVTSPAPELGSHAAYHDSPFNHESHDWIFFVKLDPEYEHLQSNANHVLKDAVDANGHIIRLMQMEWEMAYFPAEFRPVEGDKVWLMGRWIWDCGHFSNFAIHPTGYHPTGYSTEIHPPLAYAVTRFEPTRFSGDDLPSPTYLTRVFISGDGYIHGEGAVRDFNDHIDAPVTGRDYEFDIDLPPRPPGEGVELRAEVRNVRGGVTPELTIDEENHKIHVRYPLRDVDAPTDQKFSAVIVSGWRQPVSQGYRLLEVNFESIKINKDHDPLASGEWQISAGVNGKWLILDDRPDSPLHDIDEGEGEDSIVRFTDKRVRLLVPEEGGVLDISTTGWESDAIDEYFATPGWGLNSVTTAILLLPITIWNIGAADDNDPIGQIHDRYDSQTAYGAAQRQPIVKSSSPHPEDALVFWPNTGTSEYKFGTDGDYELTYTIKQIGRIAAGLPIKTNLVATVTFENITIFDTWPYEELRQGTIQDVGTQSTNASEDSIGNINNDTSLSANNTLVLSSDVITRVLNEAIEDSTTVDSAGPNIILPDECDRPTARSFASNPECRKTAKMVFEITVNDEYIRYPSSGTIDIPLEETYSLTEHGRQIDGQTESPETIGPREMSSIPPIRVPLFGLPLEINITAVDHAKTVPTIPPPGFIRDCPPGDESSVCLPFDIPQQVLRVYLPNQYGEGVHTEQSRSYYLEFFKITYRIEIDRVPAG